MPTRTIAWRAVGAMLHHDLAQQFRRQRQIEQIWAFGPRVLFEMLDELRRRGLLEEKVLDDTLAKYGAVDPIKLRLAGGDRFAARPLHLVQRR